MHASLLALAHVPSDRYRPLVNADSARSIAPGRRPRECEKVARAVETHDVNAGTVTGDKQLPQPAQHPNHSTDRMDPSVSPNDSSRHAADGSKPRQRALKACDVRIACLALTLCRGRADARRRRVDREWAVIAAGQG